jgi:hypothetical protein
MKKIMMVAIVLIASVSVFAQTKITGFGKLQLGMEVKDIPELSGAKFINGSTEYFEKVYESKRPECYEAKLDSLNYSSFGTLVDKERIFHVGQISVTENITLSDVELKFYNDKLYSIKVGDGKVDELITTKYGAPKEEVKTEDHTFQNGYGAKFVKTDLKKTHTWTTNDPQTECYYVNNYWYNDSGKLLHIDYCYLTNNQIAKLVQDENKKVIVRRKQREEDKKKALTAGF